MRAASTLLLACLVCLGFRAAGSGTLIVLNKSDHTASLIDTTSGEVRHVVETGEGPHEVVVTHDGRYAVIADYGDRMPGHTLTLIDVLDGSVVKQIDLGKYLRPHGLTWIGSSSRLLVTAETRRALIEVDIETGEVVRAIPTGGELSHMVAAAPDGKRAYVANIASGTVSVLDLEKGELLETIKTGAGCEGIDVTPDGSMIWTANRSDNTVSIIDAESLEIGDTLITQSFPIRVKITPDGERALVACARAGLVQVYDVATRELLGEIEMNWRAAEGSEEHLFNAFGESPVPIGIQLSPDGRLAWVANSNANKVAICDLVKLEVVGALEAGQQPDGLAWAPH